MHQTLLTSRNTGSTHPSSSRQRSTCLVFRRSFRFASRLSCFSLRAVVMPVMGVFFLLLLNAHLRIGLKPYPKGSLQRSSVIMRLHG
jgi:hypothetical protein